MALKKMYESGIGNYFPFNLAYKIFHLLLCFYYENKIVNINCLGNNYKILANPSISNNDKELIVKGYHEKNISALIKRKINQDDVFIDIGANIGYYSLFVASIQKYMGEVYAFEPGSKAFYKLQENIRLNNFNNVNIYRKGVGNENKTIDLNIDANFTKSSILNHDSNNILHKEEIEIIRLDDFFQNKRIDFMKIDVEGYELEVLKGAKELISCYKPKLIFEFTPRFYKGYFREFKNFLNFLKDKGYKIYNIQDDRLIEIKNIDSEKKQINLYCEAK